MEKLSRQSRQRRRWDENWSAQIDSGQRRRMSRIRAKDTTPELKVRRIAFRLGYRFRLHRRDLPGTPDLVFPRLRKIIDVRGCFWHAHSCLKGRRPSVRKQYWHPKLDRNVTRDRRNLRCLQRLGWRVLIVWDCETADDAELEQRLVEFLGAS